MSALKRDVDKTENNTTGIKKSRQEDDLLLKFNAPLDGQESTAPQMICELGKLFYDLGWVSGTGGGISIKNGNVIFVAPSGVQKERLKPEDIFMIDKDGSVFISPKNKCLKKSQCTPLFLLAYNMRDAGAVIHNHSKNAVLATMIAENEFKISHIEMIKGIRHPIENRAMRYDEVLTIPIIDNTLYEEDLTDSLEQAIQNYPNTNAVLVRRHGIYVWGDDWIKAKTMAECYDYLLGVGIEMKKMGIPLVKSI